VLELRKETETEETNAEEAERGRFRQPEDEQPWARGGSLAGRAALPGTGNSRALPVRATRVAAHHHPAEELASADGRGGGDGTLPGLCAGADAGAVPQFGDLIWQKKGRRVRSRRP
jgi:hypothetical protein